jgi:hypothetical protein
MQLDGSSIGECFSLFAQKHLPSMMAMNGVFLITYSPNKHLDQNI